MSGDATLDSFADPEDGDESAPRSASPLTVTSSWTPDATCASCGESTVRLWRDGDSSVCVSCARWTETGGSQSDQ
ncbi:DUF7573 domain-containing protein [Halobacterium jilantaiense]|uniref:DUF7573 domain-containing protein n=1 Tax=Halobacterium jilantaiense TaxID=355548 RepID=A0A1I0PDQ5_9EURY|nr:hypothetical protein [Halobacterium jilantaiense]SEW12524.1 hypothetical protein SAMN04487945_1617 [Halobacterium jilantaiense]